MYRATSKGKIPSVKNAKSMAQIKTVSQSQSQQHFQPGSAGTIGSSSSETATTTESYRPTSQRLAHVDSFHMFKHSNTPMSGNTNSSKLNNNNKSINSNNISNISNLKASSPTTLRYANLSSSSALSPLNKKNSISSINLQNSGNKSSNNINRSINSQNINNKQKNALSVSSSQNTAPAMSLNSVEPFALDQQIGGNQLSNSQATKVARLNLFDEQPNGQGILEGNKRNNNSNNLNDINKGKDIQREEEININKKQNWQQQQQQQDYPQTKRVSNQLDGVNEALQSRQSNYDNNINNDADGVISKQERTSYTNYNKDDRTDRQLSSNGNQRQQLSQKQQREQDTNDNNNIPNGQKDERNNNNSRKDQKDIRENQLDEKDNNNYKQNSKNNNNNGYQQPQNGNSKQPYDQYNNRSQGSQPYQDYDNNSNWGQQYERNRSNNERNPQQYRDNNSINNTSSNYQSDRLYPPMNGNPRYNNNYNDHPNSFSNDRHNQQYPDSRNIPFNDRNGQYYHDRNSGYDNIPSQGMPFYNGNHDSRSYQNNYHDKGSAYYYDRNNNYGYQGYPSHPSDGGYYRHNNNNRDGYYQDRDNNNMNGYSNNRGNNNDWYLHDRMGDYDTRYPMKQQRYKNSSSDFEQLPHYDDRSYNRYQDDRIDQFKPPSYQNDGFRSQNNNINPQDRRNINTTKTPPNEMRYISECFPRTDDNTNTSDRWRPPNAMSYDQFKQQNSQMIMNNSNNINNQLNGSTASSPVPPLSHSQNRASRGEQSQQYPQYYMDKGYNRHNNDVNNNMNITDQKIIPPQSLPDRSLNKSANGFYEHHRSTPSGGSNYRPGQSPNQRYQGEYEYQHNNWMNNSNNQQHSNSQQPYIQSRDKSPVSRFPPGDRIIMHERSMDRDRERNTPTGANSTNTDRLYSQQFSKREQQQLQDDSVNFKNRSSFQDYSNNNPTGKQVGGSTTTTTTSSRYQQQPDYASFQRKEQGQYTKDYMDLINKNNNNNNSMQDEPSSQPSKDTQGNPKRSFLKEMPENKPYEQQQQQQPQLKEGGGARTNSAASALENIKARGNLKSQNDNDGKGIGKQQQQTQHFDEIPVKGMKAGMNFDDMPIKGGKNTNNNVQQNFDDMPIKGNKDQPQSYDDIPIKGNNNNNKINNNRNLSQNYDDIPINGAKNSNNSNTNKNNYDDLPIKGSTGNQSGFQSERNTPNNQKFMGRAQAVGKRRLETEDGWEGVGDEQAVEEGVGQNNRQVYSREVKTLQSNYDSNDDRPIKPSNQGGKYDLKGIQQQTQQLNNKNSQFNPQSKGGAAALGQQQQQKIDPNVPIPNKKVKLFECREGCGRSFAEESLAKHEGICKKVFQQKRKKFDSAAMRTDIEELKEFQNSYAGTVSKKQNNNPNNKNTNKTSEGSQQKAKWQKQSEALRAVINANKPGAEQQKQDPKAQALMNEALFGEEYVQCNFCNRRFNATAAKRHIPFCEKKAKENHGKVKENVAKGSNGNSIAGNNVGNKMNNNSNSISNVVGIASKVGKKETNVIQTNNNTMNVPRRNIAMNDRKQQY